MFAQAQLPDPNHFSSIGWVCVILVAIVVGLRQGIGFVRDMKDKPAAGDVAREAAALFTPKTDFEKHVETNRAEHENLFRKIGGVERGTNGQTDQKIEALRLERREDMRSLHNEINEVGKKVAGLETETTMQNQIMASLGAKLDRLIERKS